MYKLSVASTFYNSEDTIIDFIKSILTTIKKLNISEYEIILVNDGSTDKSFDRIYEILSQLSPLLINSTINYSNIQGQ